MGINWSGTSQVIIIITAATSISNVGAALIIIQPVKTSWKSGCLNIWQRNWNAASWNGKLPQPKKKAVRLPATDKAALKRKLTKLKELYVNDLIDIEDYKRDYQIYTAALKQIPEPSIEPPPDFAAVRKLLDNDFKNNLLRI